MESLPIVGRGKRPEGACGCGLVNDNKPEETFGMPSGHSQIAWSVSTYLILKYFLNSPLQTVFLLAIATYISFSRLLIGCHTTGQVVTGAIIGILCGFTGYTLIS